MKTPFSKYLQETAPDLKELVSLLDEKYEYVSLLATDSAGIVLQSSRQTKAIVGDTMMTERGIVIRVMKDGLYSEYAFNDLEPGKVNEKAKEIIDSLEKDLALLKETKTEVYETKKLSDESLTLFVEMETEELPENADLEAIMEEITKCGEEVRLGSENIVNCNVTAQSTHVSKMFLTKNRDLRQSYVYSEASILSMAANEEKSVVDYTGVSGRKGPELFKELKDCVPEAVSNIKAMLKAKRIVPGEYEIITSPVVTGLIAHEAFGHGVEMDMFVKERALGKEYIGKRVGSDIVSMHEGANAVLDVASFAFDDEGTLVGDVTEIDHGILKTGICDALSAARLGIEPTGNGKRENFEHKAYTRMTNTMFDSGEDSLEDMIASVKNGYLLEGMQSGMEDPKHWGIQCIIAYGKEIKDGKLTGETVSPIVLTGYVPELLGNISMASTDRLSFGNGGCGKGYKEWVKVSDGGPYLKTKARLG